MDVDDPLEGALVPGTREQLGEFEQPEALVTLADGRRVAVRRHRDALNHMRSRPTGGSVTWGLRLQTWQRYESMLAAADAPQAHILDELTAQGDDRSARNVMLRTSDPVELIRLADMLDRLRRSFWAGGQEGDAREVAVYVGALRVRADELADDLKRQAPG